MGCKTRRQSWWTLNSDGRRVNNPTGMVTTTPIFAQPSENSSSLDLGDQTCNSSSNNYPCKLALVKWFRQICCRSDTDGAGDSATRQSVTGYHCDAQNVKQSSAQPMLVSENCWDLPNSSRNFTRKSQFVSKWIQTRQDTFCSAQAKVHSNTSRYNACQYSSGFERNVHP